METSAIFRGLIFLLFSSCFLGHAQVGVNTTSPQAQLDIRSSNVATPANTDGILIPKIDEYPVTNPTAAQDGMLVFATGNGTVTKGFYYWDNGTTSWIAFAGATIEKIDDLIDGKSDNDGTDDGSSIFLGIGSGANDDASNNLNVGIGFRALFGNISGEENTAIGYQALTNNTIGVDNVAIGANALANNTVGNLNTAVGETALTENISGSHNVGLGHRAMFVNDSGSDNVSIGSLSLYENISGNRNTAIGYETLARITTNGNNTALGYRAGRFATGSGNVFIGYRAGENEANSNRLYLENTNSTTPLIYGEFDNDFLRINGDLEVEKITNASATVVTPFGFQSSLKLFERGSSGDFGFEFQYDGSPDKLYLWSRTFVGNEGIRMTWLKDGRVGMNDTSPDARLDIEAINQATPNNTDGILIPRIDAFPTTNPGANQNGMLVFLTTDNSFYYWNNTAATWISLATTSPTVERINDLVDGRSDNDGSNDGSSVFLGLSAGANDNQTDNRNVGIGYFALTNNTSGSANTAVGSTALISNTSGSNNSAFGRRALYWSTTGSGNTAFGSLALEENTSGYSNLAAGYEALTENTTGYQNSALGYEALESNTSGYYNTAVGHESMALNDSGYSNTALGYESLQRNTSGHSNIAIGFQSLESNTIGAYNTALGFDALENNSSGSQNIAIGYQASH
ncbi:MAG: hypothetical protein HRU26_15685, partial [Psychroserpens sp.]|nr:hypothetical protein [Psychroserpens sp.]